MSLSLQVVRTSSLIQSDTFIRKITDICNCYKHELKIYSSHGSNLPNMMNEIEIGRRRKKMVKLMHGSLKGKRKNIHLSGINIIFCDFVR